MKNLSDFDINRLEANEKLFKIKRNVLRNEKLIDVKNNHQSLKKMMEMKILPPLHPQT